MEKVQEGSQTIKIVSYHDGLAQRVADMWTKSKDSWGGSVKTEEQVLEQQQSSDNLDTFLAVLGEEVVGYCGFSVYKEDVGALYVPLLNVRPDFHGKKVGKKLLLHALTKAIDQKWPRLDLYTWAGNLKAVPLYKRCGFFWEDNDQYTHLMNFIPTVRNNELINHYLKDMDWYEDLKRNLEIKPDGEIVQGFTHYEYIWQKEKERVIVKFEKNGRGISYIETKDFQLELVMENHECIEEMEQQVYLKIKNKMTKPVSMQALADNHGRIRCSFSKSIAVMGKEELTVPFPFVVKEGEEPVEGKTFPAIKVDLSINGLETSLQLGILPKLPISIETKEIDSILVKGMNTYLDLELENNLEKDISASLTIPLNNYLLFEGDKYSFTLAEKEKKWLRIPVKVKECGCFKETITCEIFENDCNLLSMEKEMTLGLKGIGQRFVVENEKNWKMFNGPHQLSISKTDQETEIKGTDFTIFAPSIGKPYSNELSKLKPYKVSEEKVDSSIAFKMFYRSSDFPGIDIVLTNALFAEGYVKRWVTLINNRLGEQELSLQETFYDSWQQLYLPLKGEVVLFNELSTVSPSELASKDISGNWYFSSQSVSPFGVAWDKKSKIKMDSWKMHIESTTILKPNESFDFPPICINLGAYRKWQDWELAAEGIIEEGKRAVVNDIMVEFNNGNPILEKATPSTTRIRTFRNQPLIGGATFTINEKDVQSFQINTDELDVYQVNNQNRFKFGLNKINTSVNLPTKKVEIEELFFVPSDENITTDMLEEDGLTVYRVSNGVVTFKASPSYYPGIYSIEVNEKQWLEHSFPKPIAKSWWNPWCGGIKNGPPDLNMFSLLKEQTVCNFTTIKDKYKNAWTGLKLETTISHHQKWKGLKYVQYYVTMPGVPLLITFVEIIDHAGYRMAEENWHTNLFMTCNDKDKCVLHMKDDKVKNKQYFVADEEQEVNVKDNFYLSLREDKLYYIASESASDTEFYSNKEAIQLISFDKANRIENRLYKEPNYLLFTNEEISLALLNQVRRIVF
ncbi:GNAT family N-acetyltransferase [Niallia sp. FSL W8-0635]|uniref:GNAT family N-acetyltransferase n=1 Tax=Niallia sp. FSL W8-0635 TaxID=2975337 RepID=UPI0009D3A4C7|nr:ribosomal-protein-alanine acetyltransferase [Mycobacteroides abscessus subsp. abscessus]HEO8421243.1 GNAT family N-acetyltransferase [Yersinia enterocolitica]